MIGKKNYKEAYKLNKSINVKNENLKKFKIITESYLLNKMNRYEESYLFIKDVLEKNSELKKETTMHVLLTQKNF